MRIVNVTVTSYSGGSFMVVVGDPETHIQISMTEEETAKINSMVTDMFLSRQKAIAKEVETARPLMIELTPQPVPIDDDIPF